MANGVVRFKFVDNPSDKPEVIDWVHPRKYSLSPAERQRRFLAALHADGFEPFDGTEDGVQFWRRPTSSG